MNQFSNKFVKLSTNLNNIHINNFQIRRISLFNHFLNQGYSHPKPNEINQIVKHNVSVLRKTNCEQKINLSIANLSKLQRRMYYQQKDYHSAFKFGTLVIGSLLITKISVNHQANNEIN